MGLFGRSRAEREQIARLEAELASVHERLADSVRVNARMSERLEALDNSTNGLEAELRGLRSSNAELSGRLAAVDDLGAHVDELSARLIPAPTEPPPPPPTSDGGTVGGDPAALDELHRRIAALSDELEALDARLTGISTELANQLTELGHELDAATQHGDADSGIDDASLTARLEQAIEDAMFELQDGQVRLAAEQARYQIQFRQDLADLADRLRRPR